MLLRAGCALVACALIAGCGGDEPPFAGARAGNAGSAGESERPRSSRRDSGPESDDDDRDAERAGTSSKAGAGGTPGSTAREADAGPCGARVGAGGTAGCDADTPEEQTPTEQPTLPLVLPEVSDAERSGQDRREELSCADVPGVAGFYTPPSLHAFRGLAYVFSVDASEATPRVLMHVSPIAELAFANPATLLYGAHEVDVIAHDDGLWALVGRQFYTLQLASIDGFLFAEDQVVGPHQPTYDCEGFPPPRYFRGREPVELIAVGNDFNGGLFGCQERVFVARRGASGWDEPVEVGRGDVVFAHHGATRATIVTTLGVLLSRDDGATFQQVTGFDAAGGAFTGSQLVLLRSGGDGVRVLASDDDGTSWRAQTRVLPDQANGGGPFIAADGATLAVALATASEIVLATSSDDAVSWTEPRRIARPSARRLLALAQHGDATLWLTSGSDGALELCALQ